MSKECVMWQLSVSTSLLKIHPGSRARTSVVTRAFWILDSWGSHTLHYKKCAQDLNIEQQGKVGCMENMIRRKRVYS